MPATRGRIQEPPASRAGRRPKSADGDAGLSKEAVIQCAVRLAKAEPLSELSIVRIAREMGVARALVHYYIGSRDELLSSVMNLAFKSRVDALPQPSGNWRNDLYLVCKSAVEVMEQWPGLATYSQMHNRFRLFQRVEGNEVDYGLRYLDHVGRILKSCGFTPDQAARAYHLMMHFILTVMVERENRLAPATHKDFILKYIAQFEQTTVEGASFLARAFVQIDNETTFESGMNLLLDGFESWLDQPLEVPVRTGRKQSAK